MDALVDRQASDARTAHARLFTPLRVGKAVSLSNRLAVAPMTRVSATADGHAAPRMAEYYEAVAQLMHAGALSQGNRYRTSTKGPSAVLPKGLQMAFYRGDGPYRMPESMSDEDIAEAIEGFAQAARRAREAGFDGVEIHAANGYLLDQFLTAYTNLRQDRYGGSLEHRLRLTVEVIQAIRRTTADDFIVGVRCSQGKVNDFTHKWEGGEADATQVFLTLGALRAGESHDAFDPGLLSPIADLANAARHRDQRRRLGGTGPAWAGPRSK